MRPPVSSLKRLPVASSFHTTSIKFINERTLQRSIITLAYLAYHQVPEHHGGVLQGAADYVRKMPQQGEKKMVSVDVNEFVRTRDAVSLS